MSVNNGKDVRASLKQGAQVSVAFQFIPDPTVGEVLGRMGFDVVIIDTFNIVSEFSDLAKLVKGVEIGGATPIVRVKQADADRIRQILDMGAQGIMHSGVNNKEQAQAVVDAVKYQPIGKRSPPPTVLEDLNLANKSARAEVAERSNARSTIWLGIENPEALRNLPEIVKVPNIDVVMVGIFTLARQAGLEPYVDAKVVDEMKKVHEVTKSAGVSLMTRVNPPVPVEFVKEFHNIGMRTLYWGTDIDLLKGGCYNMSERRAAITGQPILSR